MSKMTPKEAISYIENYSWSTTRLGLERTRTLLREMGDPQKKLRFIHVAGSNGKGSTCAMLASILKSAGYKTGLYISPYIQVFNERIQINGEYIPGERLAEITERVKEIADNMEDHPSHFELLTAIAIEYYYEEQCDIVVLEVGMGGALDSTNAIDAPEVAVLTNIGLEHTEYLGDTIEKIAETKAGIIKEGTAVVCYDSGKEVTDVIKRVCDEKKVHLRIIDMANIVPVSSSLDGQKFKYIRRTIPTSMGIVTVGKTMLKESDEVLTLPLLGNHQLHNAAVVLKTIEVLREKGWNIYEENIKLGLEKV
ncbi:MAG: bifunctional folylpolyglutamate synthase/dihydrofolate synthase, partial [Firmicutes bacterium]|nr:bifunctional folylpolyglutamate synthase/dihydrofolate synthase [Bacillota bacterium]